MSSFEGKNVQTQYNFLGYRIDLYFHDYKVEIEIDMVIVTKILTMK